MIRRINLWGGPNTGKSTLAYRLCAAFKSHHRDIEYIHEEIKLDAYAGKVPTSFDPLVIFSRQLGAEDSHLRHVQVIVSDSPILMNAAYSAYYGFDGADELRSLAEKFERRFPSTNLYLPRQFKYQPKGRFQAEEEIASIDQFLLGIASQTTSFLVSPVMYLMKARLRLIHC